MPSIEPHLTQRYADRPALHRHGQGHSPKRIRLRSDWKLPPRPSTLSSPCVSTGDQVSHYEEWIVRLVFPILALSLVTALVSSTLVHAQMGNLQIIKAVYGKSGAGKDVTRRLQLMIQNNTLSVKVTNDNMGGDPNKGADKTVKVDYTFRGQRKQVVVKEGAWLKLP